MKIKTLKDIKNLKNKKVLLRVDFNVPVNEKGEITDDYRIIKTLPTIKYLQEQGAKIIITTHFKRPAGKPEPDARVKKIAQHLEKLLKTKVIKSEKVIDNTLASKLKKGEILFLENVRFDPGEEKNDKKFIRALASMADIYVNDAFGAAHRKHASTAGVAKLLPPYAGFLMQSEIENLSPLLEGEMIRPITFIFGGVKMDTKIGMIKNFIINSDFVLLGGALANTFLFAAGYNTAESLIEKDKIDLAQETMLEFEKYHERLILPHDVLVASKIEKNTEILSVPIQSIEGDMKIVDIGTKTTEKYCNIIRQSGTIIWNGPMGIYEIKKFDYGTRQIAKCIAQHNCISIIGGGDTVDALHKLKIPEKKFTHVSTGGGAVMEFLEGKTLPGIKPLLQ